MRPDNVFVLSGKLQAASALVRAILMDGERAVVLATELLPLQRLRQWLSRNFGVRPECRGDALWGGKPTCDRFNDDAPPFRVLLLTTAIAPGLTCISANHLLLLDPAWPAVVVQVLGRILWPGERRPCFHY